MSMAMPEGGIAVDPNEVIRMLRQRHAEQLDGLTYENTTLRVALNDAQATIRELRVKNEELATALAKAKEAAEAESERAGIRRAAARA